MLIGAEKFPGELDIVGGFGTQACVGARSHAQMRRVGHPGAKFPSSCTAGVPAGSYDRHCSYDRTNTGGVTSCTTWVYRACWKIRLREM